MVGLGPATHVFACNAGYPSTRSFATNASMTGLRFAAALRRGMESGGGST
jgi:hypothetical protein